MNIERFLGRSAAVMGVAVIALTARAQAKIGVVSSATGPTALVGVSQKNSVALLPNIEG